MYPKIAIMMNAVRPYRRSLFNHLADRFQVAVCTGHKELDRPEWEVAEAAEENEPIRIMRASGIKIQTGPDKFLHINPGYASFLVRERPDAIVTWEMGFRTLVALLYGTLMRVPVWIVWEGTPHAGRNVSGLKQRLRHMISRRSVRWISFGSESTDYLLSLGIPADRMVQTQNSVDDTQFLPIGQRAEFPGPAPHILTVGQLIERKGIDRLIKSAGRVSASGIQFSLHVLGTGPEQAALEQLASDVGFAHLNLAGGVNASDMAAYYRGADAFIFPTLEDVWGLAVNEAILCGLPVAVSKHAGCARDLVPDSGTFDPLSDEQIDAALTSLVLGRTKAIDRSRVDPIKLTADLIATELLTTLRSRQRSLNLK